MNSRDQSPIRLLGPQFDRDRSPIRQGSVPNSTAPVPNSTAIGTYSRDRYLFRRSPIRILRYLFRAPVPGVCRHIQNWSDSQLTCDIDVDRFKALKIYKSYFFLLSIPSMFMTLCHTLVGYLLSFVYIGLNCVFFREEAELPTRPPPPSGRARFPEQIMSHYG